MQLQLDPTAISFSQAEISFFFFSNTKTKVDDEKMKRSREIRNNNAKILSIKFIACQNVDWIDENSFRATAARLRLFYSVALVDDD